jgi:hypothetical protein
MLAVPALGLHRETSASFLCLGIQSGERDRRSRRGLVTLPCVTTGRRRAYRISSVASSP